MRAIYVLACVLLILLFIGQVKLGIRLEYAPEGLKFQIRLGAIRVQLLPVKAEKKSKKQKKHPKKQKEEPPRPSVQKKPSRMSFGEILAYIRALLPIVLDAAGSFRTKLCIDQLHLRLVIAAANPADAVLRYGAANAALGSIYTPLSQVFTIKDEQVGVELAQGADETTLKALAAFSIKIGQLTRLGLLYGVRTVRTFLALRRQIQEQPL